MNRSGVVFVVLSLMSPTVMAGKMMYVPTGNAKSSMYQAARKQRYG